MKKTARISESNNMRLRRANGASQLVSLWALIALVSPTSEVVARLATGAVPRGLLWFRILVLIGVIAAGFFWKQRGVLRAFSLAYLFQLALVALFQAARESGLYQSLRAQRGFIGSQGFLSAVFLTSLVPAVVWVTRRADKFNFRVGDLRAPVRPYSLPAPGNLIRWSAAAPLFAVISALSAWAFVGLTGTSAGVSAVMAGWAVLFATINAFGEEFVNRIVLASAVQRDFGVTQAALVSAFIFGVGHWNGLPAGPLGVLMTFILGFVTAKAMFETRGLLWPWFMHFVPDCVLFYYWGIGSVAHATIGSGHL